MRKILFGISLLAILVGLIWIGQGTGYFPYPPTSFMIDQTPWAYRGLGVAILGLIGIFASRRMTR